MSAESLTVAAAVATGTTGVTFATMFPEATPAVMLCALAGAAMYILTAEEHRIWKQIIFALISFIGGVFFAGTASEILAGLLNAALGVLTPPVHVKVSPATRVRVYENDTDTTDANGLPAHSISCIVDGGDATTIATVISKKKDQGTSTFGTTTINITGKYGEPKAIKFSRPVVVEVFVDIEITTYPGYTSQVAEEMKVEIGKYINSLRIGDDVLLSRIYSPANLGVMSGGDSKYYDINSLKIGKSASTVAASNIVTAYNEAAHSDTANIKITPTT